MPFRKNNLPSLVVPFREEPALPAASDRALIYVGPMNALYQTNKACSRVEMRTQVIQRASESTPVRAKAREKAAIE